MSHQPIYVNNDNIFTLTKLKNQVTDTFVNDALVELTIQDSEGAAVGPSGFAWPVTMVYISGSNGSYQAVIDKIIEIEDGGDFIALIVVNGSGIADGEWQIPLRGIIRRE